MKTSFCGCFILTPRRPYYHVSMGMHVHGLVGLQDAPRGPVLVALHQVHRPVAHDGRPALGRNLVHQRRQPAPRLLVIRGGRLGDPGNLGGDVPELEAAFPGSISPPRQAPGRAAGERVRRQLRCRGLHRVARNVRPGSKSATSRLYSRAVETGDRGVGPAAGPVSPDSAAVLAMNRWPHRPTGRRARVADNPSLIDSVIGKVADRIAGSSPSPPTTRRRAAPPPGGF